MITIERPFGAPSRRGRRKTREPDERGRAAGLTPALQPRRQTLIFLAKTRACR